MKTMEELRLEEVKKEKDCEAEENRLQEEVLCAEITFPTKMQLDLGISNLTFKYDDVKDWIEEELSNADKKSVTFSIKFFMKTTKWIENLPEADI